MKNNKICSTKSLGLSQKFRDECTVISLIPLIIILVTPEGLQHKPAKTKALCYNYPNFGSGERRLKLNCIHMK